MANITTEKELRHVYKTPKGRSLAKEMGKLESTRSASSNCHPSSFCREPGPMAFYI